MVFKKKHKRVQRLPKGQKRLTPLEKKQKRLAKREARKQTLESRLLKRTAQEVLRKQQEADGLKKPPSATLPNTISPLKTVEEEQAEREEAAVAQLQFLQAKLPIVMQRIKKIKDLRNPNKIKHSLSMLLMYGLLMFVYQMSSRRECNRKMSKPQFLESLRLLFPELETLAHQDTLHRVLSIIQVEELEACLLDLIQQLIRHKKFARYLIDQCYPIAIDGTRKLASTQLVGDEWQQRVHEKKDGTSETDYHVYVLEANLAFQNGMVIPLISEFLNYTKGDVANDKQDCETRAFYRLAKRLKKYVSHLRIMVLLDGIYAQGPIIERCRQYKWDFMIVLQDASLPTVWDEFKGLGKCHPENRYNMIWGDRRQTFTWVNQLDYYFGPKERKKQILHVVVCRETWHEVDGKTCQIVEKKSKHAWISSKPLCKTHLHERCNLGARHRWGIESCILVEKHQGYHYEHCFSTNWNALRGYHYLMRLAHALNVLAHYSKALMPFVKKMGFRNLIRFCWETLSAPWLNAERMRKRLEAPFQLRLE